MRDTVATEYWHAIDQEKIQCDLCPRYCKLHEGQRGLCYIRQNLDHALVMTSYGRSSGYCIDPIEKKPLNHFLPSTPVLSFGTAGCNLACKFCQNWDISRSREMDTLADSATPEKIAEVANTLHCRSVAYTYNDPVIFLEYAVDVAQACAEKDIKSVAVTAGYICDAPRVKFFDYMDAVNIDLKSFNDDFYYKLCGAHLQNVLETIIYVHHETPVWLELTTLLIPGENDSDQELHAMADWIATTLGPEVPWHFTAFHPDWKMKNYPSTPAQTLTKARNIARQYGLRYIYTGNVHDEEGGSTYCHACGEKIIGRDWYDITLWNLHQGNCGNCGTKCAGVFEEQCGTWGAKRQPVRLQNY